jgi:3-hydroxypropanoate dehydrogenase
MPAIDEQALDQIFRTARSYNGYTDAPVTEADLHAIWDLMKWGPTATNQLPARFVWCTSDAAKAKLSACCAPNNKDKVLKAPVSVIIAMDRDFHNHLPELFPHVDARPWFASEEGRAESAFRNSTLQGAYFLIAARALGFDTGPMSGFDGKAVDAAFFADTPAITTNFIATLGHGDPTTIFGRLPRPAFEKFNSIA